MIYKQTLQCLSSSFSVRTKAKNQKRRGRKKKVRKWYIAQRKPTNNLWTPQSAHCYLHYKNMAATSSPLSILSNLYTPFNSPILSTNQKYEKRWTKHILTHSTVARTLFRECFSWLPEHVRILAIQGVILNFLIGHMEINQPGLNNFTQQ